MPPQRAVRDHPAQWCVIQCVPSSLSRPAELRPLRKEEFGGREKRKKKGRKVAFGLCQGLSGTGLWVEAGKGESHLPAQSTNKD